VRVLADTGLIGLLAFGLLLAALLWTLLDAARREPQPRRRAIVYGAALAVVAASVSAVLVDVFVSYKIMGVFWMIAGIGARLEAERASTGDVAQGTDDVAQGFSPARS
jgi:O-antigen ligase